MDVRVIVVKRAVNYAALFNMHPDARVLWLKGFKIRGNMAVCVVPFAGPTGS